MFTGDIVEYRSACYCGDAHFHDWPATLEAVRRWNVDAIAPGRGDALVGRDMVNEALDLTADFLESTYRPVAKVAMGGGSLKGRLGCLPGGVRSEVLPYTRSTSTACRSRFTGL